MKNLLINDFAYSDISIDTLIIFPIRITKRYTISILTFKKNKMNEIDVERLGDTINIREGIWICGVRVYYRLYEEGANISLDK
jgi:hypothetical protein